MKPTHFIGGYAQLSFGFNYYGPTGSQRDEVTVLRKREAEVTSMRIRAQVGDGDEPRQVHRLPHLLGHLQAGLDQPPGTEYMWFNNVETKPGLGYPRALGGPGAVARRLGARPQGPAAAEGGRADQEAAEIFSNPDLPQIDDYYEPWTYDYDKLITAPLSQHDPVARAALAAHRQGLEEIQWGPNWDDNLAGTPERIARGPATAGHRGPGRSATYEQAFMFYLPRICEHCLNPSCVACAPPGAMYKREEDGIVLVDQAKCRGWRFCVSGCPYKKVYFNHSTGKAEKCTLCYPRIEVGLPTICSETCVGRIRYLGSSSTTPTASRRPPRSPTSTTC